MHGYLLSNYYEDNNLNAVFSRDVVNARCACFDVLQKTPAYKVSVGLLPPCFAIAGHIRTYDVTTT